MWHGNQTASSNGQWPTGANMQWLPSTDFKKHDRLVVSSHCSVVYPPSALDIKQGAIKLPGYMTAQVKRDDMQHQGCWLDTNALVQCTRSGTTCCQQHLC